jgi:tyrosinase
MTNLWSSPGDPLFYLHHTYLDKLWWEWQLKNEARLTDITGTNVPLPFITMPFPPNGTFNGTFPIPGNGTFPPFPGNGTFPTFPANCTGFSIPGFPLTPNQMKGANLKDKIDRVGVEAGDEGDPGDVTTLGHVLTMFGLVPNTTVGEIMDTKKATLCYEYV